MTTALRVLTVIVVISAIAAFMARRFLVHGKARQPHLYDELQAKAKAANTGDPQAIRRFTDEIFNQQTVFAHAAESLKERVSRCELLFRRGVHEPIPENQIGKVFNEEMRAFDAPSFWQTNQSQIRVLRGLVRELIPGLEARDRSRNVPEVMGPAEAAYVLMLLAANKLSNPGFQIEPQEWVERTLARRSTSDTKKAASFFTVSGEIVASGLQSAASPSVALQAGLRSEDSEISAAVHRLLDRMGFQR